MPRPSEDIDVLLSYLPAGIGVEKLREAIAADRRELVERQAAEIEYLKESHAAFVNGLPDFYSEMNAEKDAEINRLRALLVEAERVCNKVGASAMFEEGRPDIVRDARAFLAKVKAEGVTP